MFWPEELTVLLKMSGLPYFILYRCLHLQSANSTQPKPDQSHKATNTSHLLTRANPALSWIWILFLCTYYSQWLYIYYARCLELAPGMDKYNNRSSFSLRLVLKAGAHMPPPRSMEKYQKLKNPSLSPQNSGPMSNPSMLQRCAAAISFRHSQAACSRASLLMRKGVT